MHHSISPESGGRIDLADVNVTGLPLLGAIVIEGQAGNIATVGLQAPELVELAQAALALAELANPGSHYTISAKGVHQHRDVPRGEMLL